MLFDCVIPINNKILLNYYFSILYRLFLPNSHNDIVSFQTPCLHVSNPSPFNTYPASHVTCACVLFDTAFPFGTDGRSGHSIISTHKTNYQGFFFCICRIIVICILLIFIQIFYQKCNVFILFLVI